MQEDWRPQADAAGGKGGRNVLARDQHAAGEPEASNLQDAAGCSEFDADEGRDDPRETPRSGRSGGAVGGTPARKRSS